MLDTLYNMVDALFTIGQSLIILTLLVGAYVVLAEASGSVASPDEDMRIHPDSPDY
jgi:hypothetical protein